MAWIYLAESEDSHSHSANGLDQLLTVKSTDTLKPVYCPVCQKEHYPEHLSGMTLLPCSEMRLDQNPWMLSTVDFPARISALQDMVKAWKESEADCFLKLSGSPKSLNPCSFSLRTFLPYALEDYLQLYGNLSIYGMTVDGRVFLPKKLAPRTVEKGGSYWPTPNATRAGYNQGGGQGRIGKKRPTIWTVHGGFPNPAWVEWLMGYPIGWTELSVAVMPWFQSKRKRRLKG